MNPVISTGCPNVDIGVNANLELVDKFCYLDDMVKEATSNSEHGVHVGGQPVNMIRYADDKAVVHNTQKGLQQLMNNFNRVRKEYGMKINARKRKVMSISN